MAKSLKRELLHSLNIMSTHDDYYHPSGELSDLGNKIKPIFQRYITTILQSEDILEEILSRLEVEYNNIKELNEGKDIQVEKNNDIIYETLWNILLEKPEEDKFNSYNDGMNKFAGFKSINELIKIDII